jgi:hypothetical protein
MRATLFADEQTKSVGGKVSFLSSRRQTVTVRHELSAVARA